ncbi:MAG: signal peptidase I [Parcubacteria group bacterium Licking1014_1]|nr:MAG: signal peptidase I [Parcubacteria group bacterium Licking1014_1]
MEDNNEAGKNNLGKNIIKNYLPFAWEIVKLVIVASVIVLPIRYFLFQPFIVRGESMIPSFKSGDYLIVDEVSYRFSDPQRGDVIIFKYPKDATQRFIKRIIGLPNETVEIKDGKVIISKDSRFVLDEKYLPVDLRTEGETRVILGADEYFVLGDNRDYSYDSRRWGTVPRKHIIGKAFLRIFPLVNLSQISEPSY